MWKALSRGAFAGAAGVTALNAVTYADMAVRARAASDMPERAVDAVAQRNAPDLLGDGDERKHRVEGLGPLLGLATGVGMGIAASMMRPVLARLPTLVAGGLVGGAAMAAADVPLTRLGLTDPRQWSQADWYADAVPHLAYGVVTVAALRRLTAARLRP